MTRFIRSASAILVAIGLLACSQNSSGPGPEASPPRPELGAANCGSDVKGTMKDESITVREGTQPMLSGKLLGVADIWERELPDVGSRMAAKVLITTPGEQKGVQQFAYEGMELSVGSDRYCVAKVTEHEVVAGSKGPGSIVLRKLP